jgi:hypothetical protein
LFSSNTRHHGSLAIAEKREPLVSHMDVLTEAKGVNANFCVFSQVGGDQYGLPSLQNVCPQGNPLIPSNRHASYLRSFVAYLAPVNNRGSRP